MINYISSYWSSDKEGWPTIKSFLEHLFGDEYDTIINYIRTTLFTDERLPILVLTGGRSTGKTTFLDFLQAIMGERMVICDRSAIRNKFNSFLQNARTVGVDEICLDRVSAEYIKYYATTNEFTLQKKGCEDIVVKNILNFIVCADFCDVKTDGYWVVKTKRIPDEELVRNIYGYLVKEIPAFLNYITNLNQSML